MIEKAGKAEPFHACLSYAEVIMAPNAILDGT